MGVAGALGEAEAPERWAHALVNPGASLSGAPPPPVGERIVGREPPVSALNPAIQKGPLKQFGLAHVAKKSA